MPEISVVMGVYNQFDRDALYLAVESILNQTFRNLEFIIYDDGSCSEAGDFLKEVARLDNRIVLIGKSENNGLAFSLNECIARAKGKYIARMDADDFSLPERLEKQKRFLDKHEEYSWCGTNAELFDSNGIWGNRTMPRCPQKKDYLKYSPFIHPTVMYRHSLFTENEYAVNKLTTRCEDYELFMRLENAGYKGYNLQEDLFRYRENQESFNRRKMKYRVNEMRIRLRNYKSLGILWPIGWIYVLRPVVGGLLPNGLIKAIKRFESRCKG